METIYKNIKPLEYFTIFGEFGKANFMKQCNSALCISSNNATYEKGRQYKFLDNQIVIK